MRRGVVDRRTSETSIALVIVLDGKGRYRVSTGIRFLDHMLELVARHGAFDLRVDATGDLDVDQHHTVEDLGIALGEAVSSAIGRAAASIGRATSSCRWTRRWRWPPSISADGRMPWSTKVRAARVGDLQTELVHDFFEGFAIGARANVHVKERAAAPAITRSKRFQGIRQSAARRLRKDRRLARMLPSTKGLL